MTAIPESQNTKTSTTQPVNFPTPTSNDLAKLTHIDLAVPNPSGRPIKKAHPISSRDLDALDLAAAKRPSKNEPLTEAEEIANRNKDTGVERLWECVGRSPNATGGFVYKYRLKDEFNDVSGGNGSEQDLQTRDKAIRKQEEKLFPALEPFPKDLVQLFVPEKGQAPPEWVTNRLRAGRTMVYWKQYNLARKLGYAMREVNVEGKKEIFLEVPDREAVLGNWRNQQERKGKGAIDISLSEGVAADQDFVELFLGHDVIMSTGPEYLHDSFFHVIPMLRLIYDSGKSGDTFRGERFRIVKEAIVPYYKKVIMIKKALEDGTLKLEENQKKLCEEQLSYVMKVLGGVADVTMALPSYEETKNVTKEEVESVIREKWDSNQDWHDYFQKRYPDLNPADVLPALDKLEKEIEKQKDIANHHGDYWQCVDRIPNKDGTGFVYRYRLRDEYNDMSDHIPQTDKEKHRKNIQQKRNEAFPALEPMAGALIQLFVVKRGVPVPNWVAMRIRSGAKKEFIERERFLLAQTLGYEMTETREGIFLDIPDRETLLSNWKKFQSQVPRVSDVDIASSAGIAGDSEFVESLLQHDVLLSSGKEFIHDHFAHVIPTLALVAKAGRGADIKESFANERERRRQMVKPIHQRIVNMKNIIELNPMGANSEELKKMRAHLKVLEVNMGALLDQSTAQYGYNTSRAINEKYAGEVFKGKTNETTPKGIYEAHVDWGPYLRKRYGDLTVVEAWKMLEQLEEQLEDANEVWYDALEEQPKDE